ncbi:hypothetical protein EI42_06176 [Thermosporothrix hazakensis]|jgi:hypothetical protein|uniref:Uncharacterized protein n=1 Tax=Thermosporothrix hazakensis TaxID=644383 RepID=A0A326U5W7_THEHA|nr:hypothetical protein EI42_06176 [Thermosporothrix hazakensis]GCE45166.1 hypothetical protein KTH_00350 [Thermosporothrix hazakensis]
MSYAAIRENLLKPFNPREVLMRGGNQNLLLVYTDIRTYQGCLHEVAPGLWSESNLIMVPAGM